MWNSPLAYGGPSPARAGPGRDPATGKLARLKVEAGQHGSSLNQLAHHLNAVRPLSRIEHGLNDARDAVTTFYARDIAEWRPACMQALGFELDHDEPDDHHPSA
jgi:hypothetical protein